jgi:hypothetical protein
VGLAPNDRSTKVDLRFRTSRVEDIRARFLARGADKPLWVTEIGWPTCTGVSSCVDEARQERYLREFFGLVGGPWKSFVPVVVFYTQQDQPATSATADQRAYGLLHHDGSPKPAWATFGRIARGAVTPSTTTGKR